ncbi:MAG: cysteine desulfurase / selenocysteine lyase [Candidatus Sumerlaeota bacterium]|nr:cysteine desulfurase / selenocysteine lyase [Candidatus Sumerlaeota bacterium]
MDFTHEFPILSTGRIHMNHAGVAPLTARARDAMAAYARDACAHMGTEAHNGWFARIAEIRASIGAYLNASADEIAFVKNTTQGLQIVANSLTWNPGECIVVEQTTFPANWYTWKSLEQRHGVRVLEWPERNHRYELDDLEQLLRDNNVRLVSLSAADFATGFHHDLAACGQLIKQAGALYCIDAIQVLGAFPIDVEACQADFLSADSHKWLLGPEGAGLFYARRSRYAEMNDFHSGWIGRKNFMDFDQRPAPPDDTARRFEEGCLNIGGVLGLGASLDVLLECGAAEVERRLRHNRAVLVEGLGELGWELVSPPDSAHSGGTASVRHPAIDAQTAAQRLDEAGILCAARNGLLRFSGHFYQPEEQLHRVIEAVAALAR